ncbi:MAG: NADH-quinone oxidoreductase subunit J [Kofleriaceae bacterium]|nr:NADH-quinone oxidoreductase subunit J [Kofleriaceae bacterium]
MIVPGRTTSMILVAALAVTAALAVGAGPASAETGPAGVLLAQAGDAEAPRGRVVTPDVRIVRGDGKAGMSAPAASTALPTVVAPHIDRVESNSKLMALVFWLFALGTIGGAIFVITRRNLIAAVMGMVGTFLGIAAAYMLLYASFLAVMQMLVYAGAIMVLFVFVVMILNKPEDEPRTHAVGIFGKGLAGVGLAYLALRLVLTVWNVSPPNPKLATMAPPPVVVMQQDKQGQPVKISHEWGSTKAVGTRLFGDYLFPFEAISILLLIAVVGAIAVARPLTSKDDEAGAGDDHAAPAGGAA